MDMETRRPTCPQCNGNGGKMEFRRADGMRFARSLILMKVPCPVCGGSGYLEPTYMEVPKNEQDKKFLLYP